MSDKKLIAPSMLAADFSNLARDIAVVNQSDADWFHLGHYGWGFCAKYLLWHASDQIDGKAYNKTA